MNSVSYAQLEKTKNNTNNNIGPSARRKRFFEKQKRVTDYPNFLDTSPVNNISPENWDNNQQPPITPPADFLPSGYKKTNGG